MDTVNIEKKINAIANVDLSVDNKVTLYNPNKAVKLAWQFEDRRLTGLYDYELLTKEKNIIPLLREYKGNVGVIYGNGVLFQESVIVLNELLKHKVFKHMFEVGNERIIPLVMGERMSKVVPAILSTAQAPAIRISRGLVLYRLARKLLKKYGGRNWSKIKDELKEYASKLNVDLDMSLSVRNYAKFLEKLRELLENADISYGLKALMTAVDNEPAKLGNLAVAVTQIVMGTEIKKSLTGKKAKVIGMVSNHPDFIKDFITGILDFQDAETCYRPSLEGQNPLNRVFDPWRINCIISGGFPGVAIYFKPNIKTASTLDVAALSVPTVVPKFLEAETNGAITNITEIAKVPANGSDAIFKTAITGGKVENENRLLGHQTVKSKLSFAFIGETVDSFGILKNLEVEADIFKLGENIPWNLQLIEKWSKHKTYDKVLLLTFLLMLGIEELSSQGSDAEVAKQSDTDAFIEDCCVKVPVTAGEKLSENNAVGVKTLDAALKAYCGSDKAKISADYLRKKGFQIAENSKSSSVFKHYRSIGYSEDELLKPRTGGNHVIGLRLKSKDEVRQAGQLRKIADRRTRLEDGDFIKFFYDQFEKLLRKYSQQFQKGKGNIERR